MSLALRALRDIVIGLGGKDNGAVFAYNLATGEQKWKWTGDGAAYSSPVVMSIGGTKMIVTLTAKNHFGSLLRTPPQKGYFDMHASTARPSPGMGKYRDMVDLIGHAHLGGKTVLYLIDGLFSGVHPRDPVPQRMQSPPFNGQWSCSLLASQSLEPN